MSDLYDVIVVGVGTLESAACADLAGRGARNLGLDRYGTPNSFGAHDAGPRVFRVAYYEHPDYVPLLKRSLTLQGASDLPIEFLSMRRLWEQE